MSKKEYHKGKIGAMAHVIADIYKLDEGHLRATLAANFPELKDKTKCANCGANMEVKRYTASTLTAVLLLKIAQQVKHNLTKTDNFTEANKVHVPTMPASDGIRHQVTIASYLGLVHQPKEWSGSGYWLITTWGWKALRGETVPKYVSYFRGELTNRSEEQVTLSEMYETHKDKVESAIARRKKVQADYRADVSDYDPREWYEVESYAKGKLI